MKLLLLLIALLPAWMLLFCWVEHMRGAAQLARYQALLKSQGQPTDASSFLRKPHSGENGAPLLVRAASQLKRGDSADGKTPLHMTLTRSGSAVAGYQQNEWIRGREMLTWDEAERDLHTNHGPLLFLREALNFPVFDNQIAYSLGPMAMLPHLAHCRNSIRWLGLEMQLELRQNRYKDATDSLIALSNAPRITEHDGLLIGELVRISVSMIARSMIWEALQADGWTDDQLLAVQKPWERHQFMDGFITAIQGEQVFSSVMFDMCRYTNSFATDLIFERSLNTFSADEPRRSWLVNLLLQLPFGHELLDGFQDQVYTRLWRFAWLDQCQKQHLERLQDLIQIGRAAQSTRDYAGLRPKLDTWEQQGNPSNFYDRLRYPPKLFDAAVFTRVLLRTMKAETERSMVLAAIALKRYTKHQGTAPEKLSDLTPNYLAELPIDFMDGLPLNYRRLSPGGWVLYSVGENGKDEQGDASLNDPKGNTRDVWARKDCVWPALATAEETAQLQKSERGR